MPELPEVETIRRSLEPHLIGRRILAATLHRRDILIVPGDPAGGFSRSRLATPPRPVPVSPADLLEGATIDRLARRGKQLALIAENGRALVVQLGMSGQLFVRAADEPASSHVHAEWTIVPSGGTSRERSERASRAKGRAEPFTAFAARTAATVLSFRDPRRFGGLRAFLTAADLDRHWSTLGPDALAITPDQLAAALEAADRPIKAALLDQAVLAGVGNIYADEALFDARIHPLTPARRLDAAAIDRLAAAVRAALSRAIDLGGSTLRDYISADRQPGQAQTRFLAYGREGQPCSRCAGPMVAITAAQRTTTFCPRCQPRPPSSSRPWTARPVGRKATKSTIR